jgi:hypothetical protein
MTRRRQVAKMEEIRAQSRVCENWTIRFRIPEYLFFLWRDRADYDLRFSLFRKGLHISDISGYL